MSRASRAYSSPVTQASGMPSVANAIAGGSNAAAAVVRSLLFEDHLPPLEG